MDSKTPTLEQVPAMLVGMQRLLNDLIQQLAERQVESELPMNVEACAQFLSELEQRPICASTVYNRVYQGTLPHYKQGARLWFYRSEILAGIRTAAGAERVAQTKNPAIVDQDGTPATIAI